MRISMLKSIKTKFYRVGGIVLGVTLIYIICSFLLFSCFKVNSMSMYPTLEPGDIIVVCKPVLGTRIYNFLVKNPSKPLHVIHLPGKRDIERNDIIVFNFPYETWNKWEKIKMNSTMYYVKRCIAIPGDSIYIDKGIYKIKGLKKNLGNIVMQRHLSDINFSHDSKDFFYKTLPYDTTFRWTIMQFGPLYIPKKGQSISLNRKNFILYKNIIEWETQMHISCIKEKIMLNKNIVDRYKFQHDYYFMAGDNVSFSIDSRYWGLVPKEFIVGKACLILNSVGNDGIKWNRVLHTI
ncbi:MAG TPA: signal peptidase I [Prevotella sp.]|nr:signal peptidase I [Prevotella sp.]